MEKSSEHCQGLAPVAIAHRLVEVLIHRVESRDHAKMRFLLCRLSEHPLNLPSRFEAMFQYVPVVLFRLLHTPGFLKLRDQLTQQSEPVQGPKRRSCIIGL